jgi:hypothetical protein
MTGGPCHRRAYRLSQVTGPRLDEAAGGGLGLSPRAIWSKVLALTMTYR